MKTATWMVSIGLTLTLCTTVVKGFTIDGTAEPAYGSPLAVQQLGSNASGQNPTNGDIAICSGSQLDAAYGVISNGTLYLVLAGNLQNDFSAAFVSKLSIFIHTGAPGQNTLANNGTLGSGPDFGAIPRMSAGGDPNNCSGCPGLTFDAGFNAAYWVGISYGGTTNPSMSVNYFDLTTPNGGNSYFAGKSTPTNSVLVPSGGAKNPFGIQATINDSNTGGVDTNLCTVNTNGAAQSIAAATVKTGVELAIPLGAIGGGNVVGPVEVTAFLSTNDYSLIFDQILGPGTPAGCVDGFAYGDPLTNNFSTLPGTHFFTVPIAGCNYSVNPANATFNTTGGSGTFTAGVLSSGGGCSWTAVSSVPSWLAITSGGSGSVGGTVSYTVATNQSTVIRTGTITVTGTGPSATNTFTVTQTGANLGIIAVDGSLDSAYGCPIAVQQIATSYGKNTNTTLTGASGSELDAAYALVQNNVLFLFLAGNIQDNGNRIHIFFMTGPGGQNTLNGLNPNGMDTFSGRSVLNWMGPTNSPAGPGLTFDSGFAPNYWMDVLCSASAGTFNYAQLWPGGTNSSGIATNGYLLGSNAGGNGILGGGTNPYGIQATMNDSNTNGVDASFRNGCYTNAQGVVGGEITQALTVTNGIEMAIPLTALGSPTGTIAVCAFVANNGLGVQISNQILGPFGTNDPTYCFTGPGRVTNTPYVVFSNYPGQHYFYVGPEMRVTSIATDTNRNINISYLTENNTNLTYQVQRATGLSNSATWANIGGLTVGTGGIITLVDPKAATNNPARFYRVRQTPLCQ